MTHTEALAVATINHAAHRAADLAQMFRGGPAFDALAQFGYRRGWYRVGTYSFYEYDLAGERYDVTQGGWAFI